MSSIKRKVNRYFNGAETVRLIVSVETDIVEAVDKLIGMNAFGLEQSRHPCARNRSEFVRQAIAEKLARDTK